MQRRSARALLMGLSLAALAVSAEARAGDSPNGADPPADPAVQSTPQPAEKTSAAEAAAASPPAQPTSTPSSVSTTAASIEDRPKQGDDPKDEPHDRSAYLSISPLHLLFPVVEITGEFRLHERIGLAGIAAIGSVDPYQFDSNKPPPGVSTSRFTVWEAGGQFVGYPIGHFDHGMQLGAELLYTGVSGQASSGGATATGTGQGLAMGPFIGYKYTAPIGFALNVQGGVEYLALRAQASDDANPSATSTAEDSAIIPLLNFNIGWAF